MRTNRSIAELVEIPESEDLTEVIKNVNNTIRDLNQTFIDFSVGSLNGDIVVSKIPSNTIARIGHRLRAVPRFRIILKQIGGGLLLDGNYTESYIELHNTGNSDCTVTLLIAR